MTSSANSINLTNVPTRLDNASQQQPAQAAQPQQQCHGKGELQTAAQQPAQAQQWHILPAEMQQWPQWCVAGDDKAPKCVDANDKLYNASPVTGPWMTFERACTVASERGLNIGYVLTTEDPFTCIDLDVKDSSSRDKDGQPYPEHMWSTLADLKPYEGIMQMTNSYAEVSTGGKGLHVWVKGDVGAGRRGGGVEVYSTERFIVCTGNPVSEIDYHIDADHVVELLAKGTEALPLQERQHMIETIANSIPTQNYDVVELLEVAPIETDEKIMQRAGNASNGDKFKALCEGEYQQYNSQSEADLALLSMFTLYSPSNEQCRRLFRQTKLGKREKATKNDAYLNRTLKIIRGRQEHGREVATALLLPFERKLKEQEAAAVAQSQSGITLFTSAQMRNRPPLKWQVKGVMPESGIGAIYGPPSSGKSFLALHMLSHIAEGKKWFDHRVKAAPVVYIAFEGTAGVAQRVEAYERENGEAMNITYVEAPTTSLLIDADWQALVEALRPLFANGAGVVCFDTLAASAPGMDENSSEGMGKLISNVKKMQKELGGVMLLVHHSGKNKEAGLRGWSGLTGALDFSIEVERSDAARSWSLKKSKDGVDSVKRDFNLKKVVLGTDDDGDEISSCVALPVIANGAFSTVDHSSSDDEMVWDHIEKEICSGKKPSGRSIEKSELDMTQVRVRESIKRLKNQGRIKIEGTGNKWLVVVKN